MTILHPRHILGNTPRPSPSAHQPPPELFVRFYATDRRLDAHEKTESQLSKFPSEISPSNKSNPPAMHQNLHWWLWSIMDILGMGYLRYL